MSLLRAHPARVVAAVGVGCTMIVVGVLVGRAVGGNEQAEPAEQPVERVVLAPIDDGDVADAVVDELPAAAGRDGGVLQVPDLLPTPDRLVPVLEPVFVGGGDDDLDAIGDMLLDRPVDLPDTPGGDGVGRVADPGAYVGAIPAFVPFAADEIDVGAEPPSDTPEADDPAPAAEDFPTAFSVIDALGGWGDWIRTFFVDPCAGVAPGAPVPDGCPPGTGGTLIGIGVAPDPFAFFARGHYLEPTVPDGVPCPAGTPGPADDTEASMTLFSRTPIDTATLRTRPYAAPSRGPSSTAPSHRRRATSTPGTHGSPSVSTTPTGARSPSASSWNVIRRWPTRSRPT